MILESSVDQRPSSLRNFWGIQLELNINPSTRAARGVEPVGDEPDLESNDHADEETGQHADRDRVRRRLTRAGTRLI